MKGKLTSKTLAILFLFVVSTAFAQDKPQALKFDEFEIIENRSYSLYDEITVAQRTERFSKQLKKSRGARAYIVYYQARVFANSNAVQNLANSISQRVSGASLEYDDVIVVDGGFRENAAFELWIAPKNAAPPEPSPTFAKSETFVCPEIVVAGENSRGQDETIVFSVHSYYLKNILNYTLKWQVSAGEIVEGQGKDFIKVKLNDSAQKQVTAFLEVEGLPLPCRKVFTATTKVGNENLILIDSFGGIANGDTRARLDNFLSELQKNPAAKGFVIIYGNRTQGAKSVENRISLYKNHFTFRGFDSAPINIVRGGYREETSGELWLSFDEEKPIPTPTVDVKFVENPKPSRKPRPRRK